MDTGWTVLKRPRRYRPAAPPALSPPHRAAPMSSATSARQIHRAQTRNGGRHCCQPPSAPSEGSAGVRQLWRPEGLLLLDPGSPAQASLRQVVVSRRTRSPASAALLGPIPCRVACAPKDAAFALERLALPAPLPAGPNRDRGPASSPAGGDRTFHPFLILPVVADPPGRRGLPSRSPIPYEPAPESLQAEKAV